MQRGSLHLWRDEVETPHFLGVYTCRPGEGKAGPMRASHSSTVQADLTEKLRKYGLDR